MLRLKACRIGLTGVKNVVALLGLLPPPPPPLPLPPPGLSGFARPPIKVAPNVVFLLPSHCPPPPESPPSPSPLPLRLGHTTLTPSDPQHGWVRLHRRSPGL